MRLGGIRRVAAQRRPANSLLPLNLSVRLIGQSWFHSTSFPLYLYILCWLNGEWRIRGLKKQTNKKTPLVRKCYLKTFSCSHKQIVTRHPLYVLETRRSPEIEQCKCAGPDRAHLVHWVHLNFRIVRDRLIISNTFFFFGFFFFFFNQSHFFSVWVKLKTICFHHSDAGISLTTSWSACRKFLTRRQVND